MASVVDGVLEVGVIEHPHLFPTPDGYTPGVCSAVGSFRTASFTLPAPYDGAKWLDRAGYTRFLSAPAGLATVGALPAGWTVKRAADIPEYAKGGWVRTWTRPEADDPSRWLSLYQLFGVPAQFTGEGEPGTVQVNGQPATLFGASPDVTSLLLQWQIGSDGLALEASKQDFSAADLIRLAESVSAP